MKIYVGGVNASGKTTLLQDVSELTGYPVLHGATLLMEYLACPNDYDRLRQFSEEEKGVAMCAVNAEIVKRQENFLLDSHYLMLINGKVSTLPLDWFRGFDLFVLVSAPVEVVFERLKADERYRDRQLFQGGSTDEEMCELLTAFQVETEREFDRVSKIFCTPVVHIRNREGDLDVVAQELVRQIHLRGFLDI